MLFLSAPLGWAQQFQEDQIPSGTDDLGFNVAGQLVYSVDASSIPVGAVVTSLTLRIAGTSPWGSEVDARIDGPSGTTQSFDGSGDFGFPTGNNPIDGTVTAGNFVGTTASGTYTITIRDVTFEDGPPEAELDDVIITINYTADLEVRIFDDKYWNGTYEAAIDTTAVTGVTVTLRDQAGNTATGVDNIDGTYSIPIAGLGNDVIMEVDASTLPVGYEPGIVRGNSSPLLRRIDLSSPPTIEVPVQIPKLACSVPSDFDIFTTCFVGGPHDNRNPVQFLDEDGVTRTMIPATSGAVLAFPRPAASSTKSTQNRYLATIEEVGSTYGLAVQDTQNRVYAGAFAKRHSDFGPTGDSGTIYIVDSSGGGVLGTFTIAGAGTTAHAIDATNAANNGTQAGWLRDSSYFDAPGKEGLGDVELNAAKTVLWTINLNDRHLYMVDVADPVAGSYGTVTDLGEVTNAACPGNPAVDWRPFALEWHDGNLYVGGTCTGESNQSAANMEIHIFRVSNPTSPGSISYTQVYDSGSLTYVRGQSTIEWSPWITAWDVNAFGVPPNASFAHVYPQPWLTDFEFDNNEHLILGLRDRFGDQIGINTQSPGAGTSGDSAGDSGLYETVSMGDILHANWDPASSATDVTGAVLGDWTLEGQTGPGGLSGPQTDDPNDGVTSLEFYGVTSFGTIHPDTAQGGLAFHPDFADEIATTGQDPFSLRSGGVSFYSTLDGTSQYQNGNAAGGHQVYGGQNTSSPGQSLLGKANGLGDIEYSCATTGQQIGNRVWLDEDEDGLQDPAEVPIAGVTVYLYVDLDGNGIYDDSTGDSTPDPVTFTTTDANGQWLFSTHPSTVYGVAFDTSTAPAFNDSSGTPVVVADLSPTVANAQNGAVEDTDSDMASTVQGFPAIELTTPSTGISAHTFDSGFTTADLLAIGNLVFLDVNRDGDFDSATETGISGVAIEIWSTGGDLAVGGVDDSEVLAGPDGALGTADDTTGGIVTDSGGCYLFSGLPAGSYYVKIPSGEFVLGQPLYGRFSSAGQGADDTTDDDNDENGDDVEADGVTSNAITLSINEPTGETGKSSPQANDAHTNLTVDLGFICPVIALTGLPDGTVGAAYSETVGASGGTGAYTYSHTGGTLPTGLNFSGNTLSGTPTVESSGNFTITATDASGCTGSRTFSVSITCPTITVASSPASLPTGTTGTPYPTASITASGSPAAGGYTFTLNGADTMPPGLTLETDGDIVGTPTGGTDTTVFTVIATDANGCTGQATFAVGVNCNTLVITPDPLPDGSWGVPYSQTLTATGATGDVTWSVNSSSLPAGITFDSGTGVLSGTTVDPSTATYTLNVTAEDENTCIGTANLTFSIESALISGTVYEDTDGDGDDDAGIQNVLLTLCHSSGTPVDDPTQVGVQDYTTLTNGSGLYSFIVAPGSYIVKETQPLGYITVTDLDSTADAGGSPADPANSSTTDDRIPANVANGETDSGNDFIEAQPMSLGDLVFCDDDNDGVYEPGAGDVGINLVTVHLFYDSTNDGDFNDLGEDLVFETDTTANNGSNDGAYLFENLMPGNYRVEIAASNFDPGGALEFKSMSSIVTDPNDNGQDNDDNGTQVAPGLLTTSPIISLLPDNEPGSGGSLDLDSTIDFGFIEPLGIGNLVFIDGDGDGLFDGGTNDTAVADVTVELYSAAAGPGVGSPLATVETDASGCYLFPNLPPGAYIVHIVAAEFGAGDDGDGDAGELNGFISLTGNSIDDSSDDNVQFSDNGIDSPDPGSTGISSVPITLTMNGESTTETGKDGASDTPDNHTNLTVDFGFKAVPGAGIGNLVFLDSNRDGDFDSATETGIDGVLVALFDDLNALVAITITQNGGCYYFGGLADGDYRVLLHAGLFAGGQPLDGLTSSPGYSGDDGADDNASENGVDVPDPAAGGIFSGTISIALGDESAAGEGGKDGDADNAFETDNDLSVDFGLVPLGFGLGNVVFIDNDGSGSITPGDGPAAGVVVELYNAGDMPGTDPPLATAVTNASSRYLFGGLPAGSYFVHIPAVEFGPGRVLENLVSSSGNGGDTGADDDADENGIDSPGPALSGVSTGVVALTGSEPTETGADAANDNTVEASYDLTVDLGFTARSGVGIGNLVFCDQDGDGIFETGDGDTGVQGVVVLLFNAGDTPGVDPPVRTTTTGSDGGYYFGNLADGTYFVHLPPSNFAASAPLDDKISSAGNGGDDGADDDAGENGLDSANPVDFGVSSGPIALAASTELTESGYGGAGDNGAEADNDLSVDLGFASAPGTVGIGNLVFRDGNGDGAFDPVFENGIDGVTVDLYLASAPPGSGSPIATTETHSGGCYLFSGLGSGVGYVVHIPAGEFANGGELDGFTSSTGAGSDTTTDDGGDENGSPDAGGVSSNVFLLTAGSEPTSATTELGKGADSDDGAPDGDHNLTADFGMVGKPHTFAEFQKDFSTLFGLDDNDVPGVPGGISNTANDLGDGDDNPDGDLYDNALEYALCVHPGSGVNAKPFCVDQLSGTVDASFFRSDPPPADVTYTLEIAPGLGSPPAWVNSTATVTVAPQGDGSEKVTYADLEAQSPNGIARLRIDITGDITGPHYTPVFGWSTVNSHAECETASNPYAPKEVFSGLVDSVSGAGNEVLDLTTSLGGADVGAQMAMRPYYIEVIAGTYEGHRFDVASATATAVTLSTTSPRNTLAPIPDLSAGQITLRAHNVLDDVATAQDFVDLVVPSNNDNAATAGRVLLFDPVNGWGTFYAYNDTGAINPAHWLTTENSGQHNVGDAVISPPIPIGGGGQIDDEFVIVDACAGFYVHSKAQAVSLTMVGVVREWDFACPLNAGYNFIGCGYPTDQSPSDRDMSLAYFTGTPDPYTADQVEFWLSDGAVFGLEGYESHFRVLSGSYDYWTTQEGSSLPDEDGLDLFENQRASFVKSISGNDRSNAATVWTWPVPWDADANP